MGIQILQQPTSEVDAGIFNLPPEFDRKKNAAQWKQMGAEVLKAQERQSILGTHLTADGWEPFKDKAGGPVKRISTNGKEYMLMFRPREIQDAVNALYGNVGKERMSMSKRGESSAGVPLAKGVLTEEQLLKVTNERTAEEGGVVMNEIVLDGKKVEIANLQVPSTKTKPTT